MDKDANQHTVDKAEAWDAACSIPPRTQKHIDGLESSLREIMQEAQRCYEIQGGCVHKSTSDYSYPKIYKIAGAALTTKEARK